MTVPRQLSTNPASVHFDRAACARVDKVYVDNAYLPDCVAYDMDAGWAFNKVDGVWQPKLYGTVRVTEVGVKK